MFASHFIRYLNDNRNRLPVSIYRKAKDAARHRLVERYSSDRADCPLVFNDLFEMCEKAIQHNNRA